jgi:hypothetical protein
MCEEFCQIARTVDTIDQGLPNEDWFCKDKIKLFREKFLAGRPKVRIPLREEGAKERRLDEENHGVHMGNIFASRGMLLFPWTS